MLTVVSHAWHSWKSAKAVALFSIVALAVGIGSTTAIYTVVHGVMLAPLPYANGDRFVALYGARFSDQERAPARRPHVHCDESQRVKAMKPRSPWSASATRCGR